MIGSSSWSRASGAEPLTIASPQPARLRVAVVGYGYWGPKLARNLAALDAFSLEAICDPSPVARAHAATTHPDVRPCADFESLLAGDTIDAVYLATPAATHARLVRHALRAGKHVMVEKPLATSLRDAVDLATLAERNRLALMAGHTFLHSPPVRAARTIVQEGRLGRILSATSRRENLGIHRSDTSVLWDLAPHDVSILAYVTGRRVSRVAAWGARALLPGTTDVAALRLEMEDGVSCFVQISWMGCRKIRETTWVGSRACLIYDDTDSTKLRLVDRRAMVAMRRNGEPSVRYHEGDSEAVSCDDAEPLRRLCLDFFDVATGRRAASGFRREAVEVVAVLEALERSLRDGGRVEAVTRA